MAKKRQHRSTSQQKKQQHADFRAAAMKHKSFSMPETDKNIVVSLGHASAKKGNLSRHYAIDKWHEIRVDSSAHVDPDILCTIDNIAMIPDESVDSVWIGHVLQCLTYTQAGRVIAEATRILKEEAMLLVAIPDAQLAATYVANDDFTHELYVSPSGPITPKDMLFGFQRAIDQGQTARQHKSAYGPESLGLFMRTHGMSNIHVKQKGMEIIARGIKLPYEHPERIERIFMGKDKDTIRPAPPKLPDANVAHTTGRFADVLDVEPQRWTALNLSS